MSDEYRFTLTIERNGIQLSEPLIKRLVVNESADITIAAAADSGTAHPVAAATMPAMSFFFLETDQAINLVLNANGGLPLNAGGLLLIVGTNLTQGSPPSNVTYANPSGTTVANLTGGTGGT